jgi:hypothetical protein
MEMVMLLLILLAEQELQEQAEHQDKVLLVQAELQVQMVQVGLQVRTVLQE